MWLRDQILKEAQNFQPEQVGCEFFGVTAGANKRRSGSLEMMWLHGSVHVALLEGGFPPPVFIAPLTLKKWMTGRGKDVQKADIVGALQTQYGFLVQDHNAADATCIAMMLHERARQELGQGPLRKGKPFFTAYELEKMLAWKPVFS